MSWKDGLKNVSPEHAKRIIRMEPTLDTETTNRLMREIDEFAEENPDALLTITATGSKSRTKLKIAKGEAQ